MQQLWWSHQAPFLKPQKANSRDTNYQVLQGLEPGSWPEKWLPPHPILKVTACELIQKQINFVLPDLGLLLRYILKKKKKKGKEKKSGVLLRKGVIKTILVSHWGFFFSSSFHNRWWYIEMDHKRIIQIIAWFSPYVSEKNLDVSEEG